MQYFTETRSSGKTNKQTNRLGVVDMDDEFLTCTVDQGIFGQLKGSFQLDT